jgi:hypothetical protein
MRVLWSALLVTLVCVSASHASLPSVAYYSEDFNYTVGVPLTDSADWDGTATTQILRQRRQGGHQAAVAGGCCAAAVDVARHVIPVVVPCWHA